MMSYLAQRRKREAEELAKNGWTVVTMPGLDLRKVINKDIAHLEWVRRQQIEHKWCLENAKPDEFRFMHPNRWLFKNKSTALLFKLSCGGV